MPADRTNTIGLKPCPFCGSTPAVYYGKDDIGDFVVMCEECGAESCPEGLRYDRKEAIEDWNKRT